MNIGSLLPKGQYLDQRKAAQALTEKWKRVGLLEGLQGSEAGNMAQLLENQARQILTEDNRTGTTQGSEEWAGIALPLVRRIFSEITAKEFVSVQPMNLPSGLVFWLDFKYGTGQPGFNTSSGVNSQNDSIFGVTDPLRGTGATYGQSTPSEGIYGPGRFAYSINDYTSSALPFASAVTSASFTTGSVVASDYNFNSEFHGYTGSFKIQKISVSTASLANLDFNGIRAFTVTGTNVNGGINEVFSEFTKYNKAAGTITFIVSGSMGLAADTLTVSYHKQPTDITRGDFEVGKTQAGTGGQTLDIPEINLELRSEAIVAKTRKLKAKWTPEFSQDLNAYQNIDAEAELTGILGEYISQEIDLELLDMLMQNAAFTDYWSATLQRTYSATTGAFSTASTGYYTQQTWFQTLGTKVQKLSNRIHSSTMRGGANFMICSPTVATILESIPGYSADTDGNQKQFAFGSQKIGSINNRFQVYKVPYMQENAILMGYRGSQYLETGAVYAPYIPLMMTPLVLDPDNFQPRKGVMTRYAKKMIRPEFYGKIYVEGLDSI